MKMAHGNKVISCYLKKFIHKAVGQEDKQYLSYNLQLELYEVTFYITFNFLHYDYLLSNYFCSTIKGWEIIQNSIQRFKCLRNFPITSLISIKTMNLQVEDSKWKWTAELIRTNHSLLVCYFKMWSYLQKGLPANI